MTEEQGAGLLNQSPDSSGLGAIPSASAIVAIIDYDYGIAVVLKDGESVNGRRPGSELGNLGPNPSPPTTLDTEWLERHAFDEWGAFGEEIEIAP